MEREIIYKLHIHYGWRLVSADRVKWIDARPSFLLFPTPLQWTNCKSDVGCLSERDTVRCRAALLHKLTRHISSWDPAKELRSAWVRRRFITLRHTDTEQVLLLRHSLVQVFCAAHLEIRRPLHQLLASQEIEYHSGQLHPPQPRVQAWQKHCSVLRKISRFCP
jgi:hypothetical protein